LIRFNLHAANGLNQLTASGAAGLTYDARGNVRTKGTRSYLYDKDNRLTAEEGVSYMLPDALGRLMWYNDYAHGGAEFANSGDTILNCSNRALPPTASTSSP
jgi:hypothetical protein